MDRCAVVAGSCTLAWLNLRYFRCRSAGIGLRDVTDREIFLAARRARATVITKDGDFVRLLGELGPPPQVIWITCGNTSNAHLKRILASMLPQALESLKLGEALVEVS